MPLVSFLGPAMAGVLHRLDRHRAGVRPARHRPLLRHRRAQSRLHLVIGITVLYGALIIVFNLLADLCYAWLDPRTRAPYMSARGEHRRPVARELAAIARAPRSTRCAALLLALIVAAALLVPWLSPYDYSTPEWTLIFARPTWPAATVRHRRAGARSAGARHVGLPHLAAGRRRRQPDQRRDRRALGRDRRLRRRAHRRPDDAHRRRALLGAVHAVRDRARGAVRTQFAADVRRHRRGLLARHRAHRARPDAVDPRAGISSRRRARSACARRR